MPGEDVSQQSRPTGLHRTPLEMAAAPAKREPPTGHRRTLKLSLGLVHFVISPPATRRSRFNRTNRELAVDRAHRASVVSGARSTWPFGARPKDTVGRWMYRGTAATPSQVDLNSHGDRRLVKNQAAMLRGAGDRDANEEAAT